MDTAWFRNESWNASIEAEFEAKLGRARHKEEYLRVQANALAHNSPEVSLRLIDRYFKCVDDTFHAQVHVDRATALLSLGRLDEAIHSYESAIGREMVFPQLKTQASLDLPYLIATLGIQEKYVRAIELLTIHEARLLVPADFFRWHAAHALIAIEMGDVDTAMTHATRALAESSKKDSGFRNHPTVGLVDSAHDDVIQTLTNVGGQV